MQFGLKWASYSYLFYMLLLLLLSGHNSVKSQLPILQLLLAFICITFFPWTQDIVMCQCTICGDPSRMPFAINLWNVFQCAYFLSAMQDFWCGSMPTGSTIAGLCHNLWISDLNTSWLCSIHCLLFYFLLELPHLLSAFSSFQAQLHLVCNNPKFYQSVFKNSTIF